ncbi:MAG: hypothetical protein HFI18_00700 [Lachnospiraceae bacterium]|nr:hypothetical protein [Lachnospiraceae bacterium]
MTLTNEDLSTIAQLLNTTLDSKLKAELQPVEDGIRDISQRLEKVDQRLEKVESRLDDVEQHLEKVDQRLGDVEQHLKKVDQRLDDVEQHLKKVDQRLDDMDQDLRNVKLHLENVTDKNIQLLSENYMPAAMRYQSATEQMETMQDRIDVLEKVVAEHSVKLQKIS